MQEGGKVVVFHPFTSRGTAATRGTKELDVGLHYWEMKVVSPTYGTDVVGLCFFTF